MANLGDEREVAASRNARLQNKVAGLMVDLESRTERLREAQQAVTALTATVASPDGLVRVTVDATGMLTDLRIAPTTFERTRPDLLARTISDLVRTGTNQVRRERADLMRPVAENLPDLSDVVQGAPPLADMFPQIPDNPVASAETTAEDRYLTDVARQAPVASKPVVDDDSAPETWLADDPG